MFMCICISMIYLCVHMYVYIYIYIYILCLKDAGAKPNELRILLGTLPVAYAEGEVHDR